MVVSVVVSMVWLPVVPSVTYQPLKWVIVGDTSLVLMYGWRVPRSAAVQVSPSWGVVVSVGAAAAGEAARLTAVTAQAAAVAVTAMSDLPMRLTCPVERIVACLP
ncbi:hypothetical protein GCM10010451_42310 [Streptomyces virens]|uniref:Secreted protein n=1 Tax=Streptomyces virens TaxID=285572 RepID=A0ABP6PSW1_9ACTN|nr:hypothetical protein GCM10010247_14160 [Streptomyces calvus]